MKRILLFVLLSLSIAAPAFAQQGLPPPNQSDPWDSGKRFGWGLETGIAGYPPAEGDSLGTVGFMTSEFLFHSAGPKLTTAWFNMQDWSHSKYRSLLGARWNVVGEEQSKDVRVTIGVNGNIYYGSGYNEMVGPDAKFSDRLGWGFDFGGGISLVGIAGLKIRTAYDMRFGEFDGRIGLSLSDTFKH